MQDILNTKIKLKFGNGKFRILCVSDIHGGAGYDEEHTLAFLRSLIGSTSPDLVLMLGDIAGPGVIHIENTSQLKEMLDGLTSPMEEKGIPWAHVYGNHDDNFGLPNREAQPVYESYTHCVSEAGPEALPGTGNYALPVYDETGETIKFAVYALDSHRGDDEFKKRYSLPGDTRIILPERGGIDSGERGVDFAQVRFYAETSDKLKELTGKRVPALMVMHVPLQEFAFAAKNPAECNFTGEMGEEISCQGLNAGLFRACVENGDVKAMCFGHDHENTCSADYCGINLAYDGYLSCHASHNEKTRGGRVYEIEESTPDKIRTYFVRAENVK